MDFYNKNNRNAAEDVKAEIIKLKEQGVDSIILDLRSNGGGSLQAATEIAGLFTEKGPQVQVKSFQNGTRAKGNKDPKVYWDGPLVVLVNNYSASASEIVSAALRTAVVHYCRPIEQHLRERNRSEYVRPGSCRWGPIE